MNWLASDAATVRKLVAKDWQVYQKQLAGFVGGLGLPVVFGWAFGGLVAAGIAYVVGRICLGLRTDYLAIATIGISEIIRALLKNMDWLTRGTLTVSPIPWPTPLPQDLQATGTSISDSFVYARLGFLALVLIVLVVAFFLVQRAYGGPWGRMMRAIRDNYIAAASMGKNVTRRQLEVFVLGSTIAAATARPRRRNDECISLWLRVGYDCFPCCSSITQATAAARVGRLLRCFSRSEKQAGERSCSTPPANSPMALAGVPGVP